MSAGPTASSLRLFIALDLPDDWRRALQGVQETQEQAAPGYFRWVAVDLLHLTVVFLGQVRNERVDDVSECLLRSTRQIGPIKLSLGAVGTFGSRRAPRVMWVEAHEPDGTLEQLRATLERELHDSNISFDEKPLKPHITLGRARRQTQSPPRIVHQALAAAAHVVDEVALFESQLSPTGPSYEIRTLARLGQA
jgi:2'-5' RNA ligase